MTSQAAPRSHPSFARPTITEAVAEVHYRLPGSARWTPDAISDFYRRVADDFPRMEPFATVGVELQLTPEGIGQRLQPARQGMRFSDEDGTLLLQLSQDMLSVNALAPYPGWERVRESLTVAWAHALEVLHPESVTRVGLRYINKVLLSDGAEQAGHWLNPTEYIPAAVLAGTGASQLRVQAGADDTERVIVQLAMPPAQGGERSLLLDIDRITEGSVGVGAEKVIATADRLHEDVWQIFDDALTDRFRAYLDGEG